MQGRCLFEPFAAQVQVSQRRARQYVECFAANTALVTLKLH
jgi:hypothetical protein